MATDKLPTRIKSAAFLQRAETMQSAFSSRPCSFDSIRPYFSEMPISESRFTTSVMQLNEKVQKRAVSASRIVLLKTNPSTASSIWRQVNTARSQMRLNKLCNNSEESVRINLRQKVQRIKSKHQQQEQVHQNYMKTISSKTLQRARAIKQQGNTGDLHIRIMALLAPYELDKQRAQERYRTRLLRVKQL